MAIERFGLSTYSHLGNEYICAGTRLEQIMGYSGWLNITGKSVFDIGCGSTVGFDSLDGRFGPWLLKLCAMQKAGWLVGLDLDPQSEADKEVYRHIQENIIPLLNEKDGLIILLQGQTFDWINCNQVISNTPGRTMRDLLEYTDCDYKKERVGWIRSLLQQSLKLLNSGGWVSIDDLHLRRDKIPGFLKNYEG